MDRVALDSLFHALRGWLHLCRIQAASLDNDAGRRALIEGRIYAIQLLLDFERRGMPRRTRRPGTYDTGIDCPHCGYHLPAREMLMVDGSHIQCSQCKKLIEYGGRAPTAPPAR